MREWQTGKPLVALKWPRFEIQDDADDGDDNDERNSESVILYQGCRTYLKGEETRSEKVI